MNTINPYFTYIFPVVTLLLGVVLNRLADFWIDNRKMKKKGKRWVGELQFLQKPMENQILALNEFLVDHKKDKFSTPSVTGFVLMKTERFKSLDRMDFSRYMEHKFGNEETAIEKTNEVLGMVEVIDVYAKKIEEVFNSYKSKASSEFEIWNSALNEFIRKCAALRTDGEKTRSDFTKDKLLFPIFPHIDKLLDLKKKGIDIELFEFQKTVLIPILLICEKERLDERTNEIRVFLVQCHDAIEKIKMEKEYLTINITKIMEATGKAKNKLNQLVMEIKNINQ